MDDADIRLENGRLIIDEGDHIREIPLEAISSYGELLGYSCPRETVEAILAIVENGEPDPDPETGDNVWTDSYTLLSFREQQREDEAFRAIEDGTSADPRSPKLRSTLAATAAVHRPVDDGECVMDRCRRAARERMGLPDPSSALKASSRIASRVAPLRMFTVASRKTRFQEKLESVLQESTGRVAELRQEFLHGLTTYDVDPLASAGPEPEEVDPVRDVLAKYGQGGSM